MASMRDVFADLKLYLNKNWLGCCYDILQSNNLPGRLLPHLRMCDLEFLGMEKDLALRLRNTIEVELWSWSGPMPRYKLVCSENAEDIHYFDAKTERSSFRRPPQMEKAIKDAGMDIEALRKDDKEVRTWLKNLAPANTHRPGKRIRKNLDRMHNPILPRKLARSFTPSTCPSSSLVIKKTLAQLPISIEATSQSPTRDSQQCLRIGPAQSARSKMIPNFANLVGFRLAGMNTILSMTKGK
ncbi:hypothetical protein AAMO2058_000939500 [Amorphochlora amoebiformis]